MSSFGKKKEPPPPPAWHPDFRDVSALPDVKVIRTSFFVNTGAILCIILLVVGLVYVEMQRAEVRDRIAIVEAQIAEHRPRNQEVVALQREFAQEERLVRQLVEFTHANLSPSLFLEALGQTLPEEIVITSVRYSDLNQGGVALGKQLVINGSVVGTPDQASTTISDYLRTFTEHPVLSQGVTRAQLTSLAPTESGGLMAFGVQLVYGKEDGK